MAKVKVDSKVLRRQLEKAQRQISRALTGENGLVVTQIKKSIAAGVSPVAGKGKFKRYSKSYRDQIDGKLTFFTKGRGASRKVIPLSAETKKKGGFRFVNEVSQNKRGQKSPVNMKVTGKLLDSLFAKVVNRGTRLIVGFTDEKVSYHNSPKANSNMPERRLLPKEGEKFTQSIMFRIRQAVTDIIKNNVKR